MYCIAVVTSIVQCDYYILSHKKIYLHGGIMEFKLFFDWKR